MPEGDTILWAANRIRPVLEGRIPHSIATHPRFSRDRWQERLSGRAVERVDTHGKHLFVRFEGSLVLHSHLGMTGSWRVAADRRPWRSAWIVLGAGERWVAELNGPLLELITDGRSRFDQRLAALGPDVLASKFDAERFLRRLRADDPTRGFGDALLDQTIVAGIGNIWKAEGCWEAAIDPWRRSVRRVRCRSTVRDRCDPPADAQLWSRGPAGDQAARLQAHGRAVPAVWRLHPRRWAG